MEKGLRDASEEASLGGRWRPGRPLHLGGTLWWADRGSTWTWSGARCGALAGMGASDRVPEPMVDRVDWAWRDLPA